MRQKLRAFDMVLLQRRLDDTQLGGCERYDTKSFAGQQQQPTEILVFDVDHHFRSVRQLKLAQGPREFSDIVRELRVADFSAIGDDGDGVRAFSSVKGYIIRRHNAA